MSFTSEIKKEICKEEIDAQMMKAQLCALFQMRASLHMNWQGMYLSFQTENATIAKHVFQIMKTDRKSTRLNSSHANESRMPSSA